MRLIDADLLLSCIEESREKNPHEDSKIKANHTIEHDHIAHLVLKQPTAFDVDKVIKRLKESTYRIDDSATLSVRDVINEEDAIEIMEECVGSKGD